MKWADLKMINIRHCYWITPIGGDRFHFLLNVQPVVAATPPFRDKRQRRTVSNSQGFVVVS